MKFWKLLLFCLLVFCASFVACRYGIKVASPVLSVSASLAATGIACMLLGWMVKDYQRQLAKGFK